FLDAAKDEYERYFELSRRNVEPGGLVVADNVLSHEQVLGAYSRARQADPTLLSVTVPLDRGLEVTTVLTGP
ncbi:MAG: O-methyltransferase, partial [Gaiellaceae bacterium]